MLQREYGMRCSIARSLELIGERWTLLVIRDLFNGNRRFGGLQSSLGIARNVLATRLARLIDEGLVEKRPYQQRPPRYEYFLTEKGLDLWPVLVSLLAYGDKHLAPEGGPVMRIVHKDCGGVVNDRRICTECGAELEVRDARAVPAAAAAPV